jgi:hypothetical protein
MALLLLTTLVFSTPIVESQNCLYFNEITMVCDECEPYYDLSKNDQ